MSQKIYVDTSAFLALLDGDEPNHEKAEKAFKNYATSEFSLCTTDYVLCELFTLLRCRRKVPIEDIMRFIKSIEIANIEIFGITMEVFKDAFYFMKKYDDHYFSMTDCVSFVVMKDLKTKDVLTTDKHFTIAGFNNLLWR